MLRASPDNVWIGRSALHDVVRMHAFRSIAGRDLAVVVGVDYDEAMAPVHAWAFEAKLFAGGISVLIMLMAGILSVNAVQGRNRKAAQDFDRTMLTATHSQLEVARSHADATAARLEATLQGMSDGVAMMDRQLRLVEWNRQFPDIAGVPREHVACRPADGGHPARAGEVRPVRPGRRGSRGGAAPGSAARRRRDRHGRTLASGRPHHRIAAPPAARWRLRHALCRRHAPARRSRTRCATPTRSPRRRPRRSRASSPSSATKSARR